MTRLALTPALTLLLLAAPLAAARAAGTPPPANAPNYEPAPVPDENLYAPQKAASEDPELRPALFRPRTQFRGNGFSPGSTSQSYEERRVIPGAGVNLSVPLK